MAAVALQGAQHAAELLPARVAAGSPAPPLTPPPWRPSVLPEFLGQARAQVRRFQAHDRIYRDDLQAAFEPLKRRLRQGHKAQRIEDLAACVRCIDGLPQQGLLHETRDFNRSRRTLDIWQLRIAAASFTKLSWVNPHNEPALIACAVTMSVTKGYCALHIDVLVCVCLHALARFYQRSLLTSDDALFADIGETALHYDTLLEATKPRPHRWHHSTKNGRWVGEAIRHDHRIVLSADSFFADFQTTYP